MDITDWRKQIDEIETQLILLLNQRARCAKEIGLIKREKGIPVYDESREGEIIDRVAQKNDGPLPDNSVQEAFRTIIHETRTFEEGFHA